MLSVDHCGQEGAYVEGKAFDLKLRVPQKVYFRIATLDNSLVVLGASQPGIVIAILILNVIMAFGFSTMSMLSSRMKKKTDGAINP